MRRSNKSPNNSSAVESKSETSSYSSSMMAKPATATNESKGQPTMEEGGDAEGSRT
jgi:hypothetical protein